MNSPDPHALGTIAAQMRLDAAEEVRREATRQLDAAVYAWHNAGASYTTIADAINRDRSTIIARYKKEVERCAPTP